MKQETDRSSGKGLDNPTDFPPRSSVFPGLLRQNANTPEVGGAEQGSGGTAAVSVGGERFTTQPAVVP
jgi:hypothetical protein